MDLDSIDFWETLMKTGDEARTIQMRGYDQIINDLKQALSSDFPNRPIYTFGSRIMGLANADSDLDIYVHVDDNDNYTENVNTKMIQLQGKIANSILRNFANWILLETPGGVCPIVIVRHIDSNILCDISFSRKLTVDQNKLVNYIFDLQPIARYMVIYLRGWAQKNGLIKFRGHIFILMVIFFLQIRGKLPSVNNLQTNLSPNIGPWKTDFTKLGLSSFNMNQVSLNESEVRNILKDFFGYYSGFNYDQMVVCPWMGEEIFRSNIKHYLPLGSHNFHELDVTYNRSVIIQDIIHLNRNKGYVITHDELNNFKMKCSEMSKK